MPHTKFKFTLCVAMSLFCHCVLGSWLIWGVFNEPNTLHVAKPIRASLVSFDFNQLHTGSEFGTAEGQDSIPNSLDLASAPGDKSDADPIAQQGPNDLIEQSFQEPESKQLDEGVTESLESIAKPNLPKTPKPAIETMEDTTIEEQHTHDENNILEQATNKNTTESVTEKSNEASTVDYTTASRQPKVNSTHRPYPHEPNTTGGQNMATSEEKVEFERNIEFQEINKNVKDTLETEFKPDQPPLDQLVIETSNPINASSKKNLIDNSNYEPPIENEAVPKRVASRTEKSDLSEADTITFLKPENTPPSTKPSEHLRTSDKVNIQNIALHDQLQEVKESKKPTPANENRNHTTAERFETEVAVADTVTLHEFDVLAAETESDISLQPSSSTPQSDVAFEETAYTDGLNKPKLAVERNVVPEISTSINKNIDAEYTNFADTASPSSQPTITTQNATDNQHTTLSENTYAQIFDFRSQLNAIETELTSTPENADISKMDDKSIESDFESLLASSSFIQMTTEATSVELALSEPPAANNTTPQFESTTGVIDSAEISQPDIAQQNTPTIETSHVPEISYTHYLAFNGNIHLYQEESSPPPDLTSDSDDKSFDFEFLLESHPFVQMATNSTEIGPIASKTKSQPESITSLNVDSVNLSQSEIIEQDTTIESSYAPEITYTQYLAFSGNLRIDKEKPSIPDPKPELTSDSHNKLINSDFESPLASNPFIPVSTEFNTANSKYSNIPKKSEATAVAENLPISDSPPDVPIARESDGKDLEQDTVTIAVIDTAVQIKHFAFDPEDSNSKKIEMKEATKQKQDELSSVAKNTESIQPTNLKNKLAKIHQIENPSTVNLDNKLELETNLTQQAESRTESKLPPVDTKSTESITAKLTNSANESEAQTTKPNANSQQASIQQNSGSTRTKPRFGVKGLANPAPQYPYKSRALEEEGRVVLQVLVDRKGRALEVKTYESSGYSRLDRAAKKVVRKWRFIPATEDGEPIEAVVRVPIMFVLES